ncbi:MAG: hypothetical protein H8D23_20905 [Candidatus Brocadiales bacterium]|nr:hypothetical protein [Candidatus Brocadiales bacterium]
MDEEEGKEETMIEFGQSVVDLFNHTLRVQDLLILWATKWILGCAWNELKRIKKTIKEKQDVRKSSRRFN